MLQQIPLVRRRLLDAFELDSFVQKREDTKGGKRSRSRGRDLHQEASIIQS